MAPRTAKIRKKIWVRIIAPPLFGNTPLGETHVYDVSSVIGKTLTLNLMSIVGDPKHQNINVSFKITSVSGDIGKTVPTAYEIIPSTLKRIVRRRRDRIDLSFETKTKDNCVVRIKPMVTTRNNTTGSVLTALRKLTLQTIQREAAKTNYEILLEQILTRRLQNTLRDTLKKIYPLNVFEIRRFDLVSGTPEVTVEEAPAQPVQVEQPPIEPAAVETTESPEAEVSEEETPAKADKAAEKAEKPAVEKPAKPRKRVKKEEPKAEVKEETEEPKEEAPLEE